MNPIIKKGIVIGVQGPVVDVEFLSEGETPNLYELIETSAYDGRRIFLEVAEHLPGNVARCIALSSTINLAYQSPAESTGRMIEIPVGPEAFGRILSVVGEPMDGLGPIVPTETLPIRKPSSNIRLNPDFLTGEDFKVLETGIKMIDLLFPLVKGGKAGVLGGAALGKSILILELMHNVIEQHKGVCVFTGAGERIREGN